MPSRTDGGRGDDRRPDQPAPASRETGEPPHLIDLRSRQALPGRRPSGDVAARLRAARRDQAVAEPSVHVVPDRPVPVDEDPTPSAPEAGAPSARLPGPEAHPRRLTMTRVGWLVAAVAVLLLVVVDGFLLLRDAPGSDSAGPDAASRRSDPVAERPADLLVAWLARNTVPGVRIAVPDGLVTTVSAGLPGRSVVGATQASAEPPDLVVDVADGASTAAGPDRTTVATFGELRVSQVMPQGRDPVADVDARVAAGRDLLANPSLTFSRRAERVVRSGRLDPRLLTVLATLATDHTLSVAVPLPAAGEDPRAVRRVLAIRSVDGADPMPTVRSFLSSQSSDLAPMDLFARPGRSPQPVVVTYQLPSPPGFPGDADFPVNP